MGQKPGRLSGLRSTETLETGGAFLETCHRVSLTVKQIKKDQKSLDTSSKMNYVIFNTNNNSNGRRKMLYENTENGKKDRLDNVRNDIDAFIVQLNNTHDVDDDGMALLRAINKLFMGVNGAYGAMQTEFDNEKNRLGAAYGAFWQRIDRAA